jgi:hypothetical protein
LQLIWLILIWDEPPEQQHNRAPFSHKRIVPR